jgi:hypothetical protein
MATFKIKLEDKAAFLNRLEKQDVPMDSSKIKDNKLEGYFEVDIVDPKQLEVVKTILKQSPKINTIKEMKKSLTKDQLKEMIRQELQGVLAEKKKMKDEDKKEKIDELVVGSGETGAKQAAEQLMSAISSGDPFWTGVALVGAVVTGVLAGPKVAQTVKGYYKALTQKDPAKAEKLKDAAEEANIDVTEVA